MFKINFVLLIVFFLAGCSRKNEDVSVQNNTFWEDHFTTTSSPVDAVVAGGYNTCLIKGDKVKCFGDNTYGQLDVPTDFNGLKKVFIGFRNICAIDRDGIWCWGENGSISNNIPPDVLNAKTISMMAYAACLITENDEVSCWGENYFGQLDVPPDLKKVKMLSIGFSHVCAITLENKVRCWGQNQDRTPTQIPNNLVDIKQIASGYVHTCALKINGEMICWSWIRDNYKLPYELPVIKTLSTFDGFNCITLEKDKPYCWLDTVDFKDLTFHHEPIFLPVNDNLKNANDFTNGAFHACTQNIEGTATCWGDNYYGQLDISSDF